MWIACCIHSGQACMIHLSAATSVPRLKNACTWCMCLKNLSCAQPNLTTLAHADLARPLFHGSLLSKAQGALSSGHPLLGFCLRKSLGACSPIVPVLCFLKYWFDQALWIHPFTCRGIWSTTWVLFRAGTARLRQVGTRTPLILPSGRRIWRHCHGPWFTWQWFHGVSALFYILHCTSRTGIMYMYVYVYMLASMVQPWWEPPCKGL